LSSLGSLGARTRKDRGRILQKFERRVTSKHVPTPAGVAQAFAVAATDGSSTRIVIKEARRPGMTAR
jgi:hypothetical protein